MCIRDSPYESDLENKDLMKNVYDVFTAKGGRVLIGTIFIGNLANFKAMFGTEFAQKVYAKIFAKTEQEFTYAYEIDDSHIGILYPEGKKLDNLLQDIKDAVNFIDQPVMIDSNLVNIGAKFGFAVCDAVMERRDFEYAAIAADAALKLSLIHIYVRIILSGLNNQIEKNAVRARIRETYEG